MEREMSGLKSDEKYLVETTERMRERNEEGDLVLRNRIAGLEKARSEMSEEHLVEVRKLRKALAGEAGEKDVLRRQVVDFCWRTKSVVPSLMERSC